MLGPVLGGWITETYSWRWIFYINLPIGILATIMARLFIFDPPYIKRGSSRVDYWGMGLLVIGMGSLQIFLDKGQQEDWFSSNIIRTLAVLAIGGLIAFVVRELRTNHPVVDLRVFRNRTYATGVFMMTILGFVLYGSTVLLPLLLQTVMGYPAIESGLAMLPRGLGSFLFMPIVGILMGKVEPRKLLGVGLCIAGYSLFALGGLNLGAGYWDIFWPQIWQGMSMGLLFVPLTTITNDPIPKEQMGNATSIFNLMRNIGASVGIASVTTVVARSGQQHTNTLIANVTQYSESVQQMLRSLTAMFISKGSDPHTAAQQAYAAISGMIGQQSAMISFVNAFRLLGIMFICMLPLVLIMRRPKHTAGPGMAH
jgi:DHA2 family multidrug resistance protein